MQRRRRRPATVLICPMTHLALSGISFHLKYRPRRRCTVSRRSYDIPIRNFILEYHPRRRAEVSAARSRASSSGDCRGKSWNSRVGSGRPRCIVIVRRPLPPIFRLVVFDGRRRSAAAAVVVSSSRLVAVASRSLLPRHAAHAHAPSVVRRPPPGASASNDDDIIVDDKSDVVHRHCDDGASILPPADCPTIARAAAAAETATPTRPTWTPSTAFGSYCHRHGSAPSRRCRDGGGQSSTRIHIRGPPSGGATSKRCASWPTPP